MPTDSRQGVSRVSPPRTEWAMLEPDTASNDEMRGHTFQISSTFSSSLKTRPLQIIRCPSALGAPGHDLVISPLTSSIV